MKKLLVFLASYVVLTATAQVSIDSTDQFSDVKTFVEEKLKQYDKSEILIVLDIDNTILTSQTDLGGDIWYQWQNIELKIKPTANQQIEKPFLYDVVGLLYELGTMELTDPLISDCINNWQSHGITTFALTSRAPNVRAATERELNKRKIHFNRTALGKSNGDTIIMFKNVSYMNGIMMTTGLNKGVMLDTIMNMTKTQESFKQIIFIDDSKKNVAKVQHKFANIDNVNLAIIYYKKVKEDRKRKFGAVLTKEQADKMDREWKELKEVITRVFPERLKE